MFRVHQVGHFIRDYHTAPVHSSRDRAHGVSDDLHNVRGSQHKSSHLSHRTLGSIGCFDCGELRHWSKDCPRQELIILTLPASVTPRLELLEHVVSVGSLGTSVDCVPNLGLWCNRYI